jgi:hypothetical protein
VRRPDRGLRHALSRAADGELLWDEWLDGRPRRLKRGKHFTGDPKLIRRHAEEAAAEHGKTAIASRDGSGKYDYLWIQFVEGEVALGEPCPVCGSTEMVKAQKFFLRCRRCGATLRSADEREVVPGPYFAPVTDVPTGEDAQGEPPEEAVEKIAAVRSSALGEIIGTRILSALGEEIEVLSAEEEVLIETTVATFGSGLRGIAIFSIHSDRFKVLSSQPEDWQEMPASGRYAFTARVPGRLLSDRLYTVKAAVGLLDPATGASAGLMDRDAASFTVTLDLPQQLAQPGVVHPEVGWSFRAEAAAAG